MTEGLSVLPDQEPGPNCGVTAIAIITGTPFAKVFQIMQMEKRKNWKGSTHTEDRRRAIRILGFEEYTCRFTDRRPALWHFAKTLAKENLSYMIKTSGHIQVLRNSQVQDQSGIYSIDKYPGRNHFVIEYSLLIKRAAPHSAGALDSFMKGL